MSSRKRSTIWNHFVAMSATKSKCNICENVFSVAGGSTSNMRRHLINKHPTVDIPEPAVNKVRVKSSAGGFFKDVDAEVVQCLLCWDFLSKSDHGSTTNMLRHLRVKHPTVVVKTMKGRKPETTSVNGHQDMETDSEQVFSVEVVLEEGDSDTLTTGNDAGLNSANATLEATQGAPGEQIPHEQASGERPVRCRRSLIWSYFEGLDRFDAAQCHICMRKLHCPEGSTSNLHRHMSKRHPEVFSQLVANGKNPPPSSHSSQGSSVNVDLSTPPETEKKRFSVEVVLEEGDSDTLPTGNDAGLNSANATLEATQGARAEQIPHEQASGERPVRRRRSLIWSHFERLDSLTAARCRICMKKLHYSESSSTGNLHRHMSKRHPEVFSQLVANGKNPPPSSHSSQGSSVNVDSSTPPETEKKRFSGVLNVPRVSKEKRIFERELELIESLRRVQREEGRALEHQKELLEKLRAAHARDAAAEREQIESLRKAQLEEAKDLSRQKEELQKEKAELQKKWEELEEERKTLLLFSVEQQTS